MEEQYSIQKRKFVEIEKGLAGKLELLCFLKEMPEKAFVSQAVEKELKPYDVWLGRMRKLLTEKTPNYA